MEEQVFCLPRVNESEALVRQPLDSAFRHLCVSLTIVWIDAIWLTLPTGRRPLVESSVAHHGVLTQWDARLDKDGLYFNRSHKRGGVASIDKGK